MKRHRCERVGRRGSDVLKSGFDGFCTDSGSLFAIECEAVPSNCPFDLCGGRDP
jgi:hypothetical protein